MREGARWLFCGICGLILTLWLFGLFFFTEKNADLKRPWEGPALAIHLEAPLSPQAPSLEREVSSPLLPAFETLPPAFGDFILRETPPPLSPHLPFVSENFADVRPPDLEGFSPPSATLPSSGPPLSDRVYGLGELDETPRPLHRVVPVFPYAARRQGIREGRVRLLMEVDRTGRVREVRVLSAEPPGYFVAASVDAARQWRFTPGRVADRDVVTRFELPIHFGGEGP